MLPHVFAHRPQVASLDLVVHADLQTQQVRPAKCSVLHQPDIHEKMHVRHLPMTRDYRICMFYGLCMVILKVAMSPVCLMPRFGQTSCSITSPYK